MADARVEVKNFSFEPSSITIKMGDTVTWKITQGNSHDVTRNSDPERFASNPNLPVGTEFKHTFNTQSDAAGFEYVCTPHATLGMKGRVIVEPVVRNPNTC